MGADPLGTSLFGNSTLRDGEGGGTTLGTDVVGGYTLGTKSNGDSGEVVMGGEDISGSTGGGEGK